MSDRLAAHWPPTIRNLSTRTRRCTLGVAILTPLLVLRPRSPPYTRSRRARHRDCRKTSGSTPNAIWSICRRHQQSGADAGDVGQSVWLQLVDQLDRVRDLASSHGWLATTGRECGRILRAARKPHAAGYVLAAQNLPDKQTGIAQHQLIIPERNAVVHGAFIEDPPHPTTRSAPAEHPGREHRAQPPLCLDKLRRHPATAALISTEAHSMRSDINGQPMVQ